VAKSELESQEVSFIVEESSALWWDTEVDYGGIITWLFQITCVPITKENSLKLPSSKKAQTILCI
jgi:hypothetical protein